MCMSQASITKDNVWGGLVRFNVFSMYVQGLNRILASIICIQKYLQSFESQFPAVKPNKFAASSKLGRELSWPWRALRQTLDQSSRHFLFCTGCITEQVAELKMRHRGRTTIFLGLEKERRSFLLRLRFIDLSGACIISWQGETTCLSASIRVCKMELTTITSLLFVVRMFSVGQSSNVSVLLWKISFPSLELLQMELLSESEA